ncbi:GntR family transcriptional regulator [Shimwellia pseudoproteus]|uniref:GntR family transcriptional regulator n=1 Tax=Shimwellia pseudoproteus TaxID=570012 RepID=UPI0018EB85D3|nr:GntR family transcriptional regulator [Shimwellia pseudoproteus]MBJ3813872.1 GntR family transcriptional regulator [Shimwellia pseudoproteus]
MPITIDKHLPIAIQSQIVGAVEYSMMAGELRPGTLLPSVRALSKQLGVAQLTVSYAYNTLKGMGLIKTIPGKGTYLMRERQGELSGNQHEKLRQRFMQLLSEAQSLDINPDFFQHLLTRHTENSLELSCPIAYVGSSNRMNRQYLAAIGQTLGMTLQADSYTFADFRHLDAEILSHYGLYLTLPHRVPTLRQRLGRHVPIYAPWLTLSPETCQKLNHLPQGMPLLLVANCVRFLPTMLRGVRRHAPQAGIIRAATLDDGDIADRLTSAPVVIYSTGCLQCIQQYPLHGIMLEYRHIPHPEYLHNELSPALRQLAQ